MTQLYYGLRVPTSASAGSAATGYPAINAAHESIDRPWRATSALANTLVFDLGAAGAIEGVLLHDCSFGAATVETSSDGSTWLGAVAVTLQRNNAGRFRGIAPNLGVASRRYVRVSIAAGQLVAGATIYSVGAMYVMSSRIDVQTPLYGLAVRTQRPQINADLANGRREVANTGAALDVITAKVQHRISGGTAVSPLIERPRSELCVLDIESAIHPYLLWPIRAQNDADQWVASDFGMNDLDIEYREVR